LSNPPRFHYEKGETEEATAILDLAFPMCEELGEQAEQNMSYLYDTKIGVACLLGDPQAVFTYSELRLQIEEKLHPLTEGPNSRLATCYNDLGMAYSMNGLYELAFKNLKKSIDIRKVMPGFKKDWLFSPFYHMGLAHWYKGELEEAATILQRAIEERVEALKPDGRISIR